MDLQDSDSGMPRTPSSAKRKRRASSPDRVHDILGGPDQALTSAKKVDNTLDIKEVTEEDQVYAMCLRLNTANKNCALSDTLLEKKLLEVLSGEGIQEFVVYRVCTLVFTLRKNPDSWTETMDSAAKGLLVGFVDQIEAALFAPRVEDIQ